MLLPELINSLTLLRPPRWLKISEHIEYELLSLTYKVLTLRNSHISITSISVQWFLFSCLTALALSVVTIAQGCPQDVESQDRDETETFIFWNSQDRDETKTLNTQDRDETRRSTFKTETRPRRSQKRLKTTVSQFKSTNWWSLSLNNLFLAGQNHYFLPVISASLMHCMDIHKT